MKSTSVSQLEASLLPLAAAGSRKARRWRRPSRSSTTKKEELNLPGYAAVVESSARRNAIAKHCLYSKKTRLSRFLTPVTDDEYSPRWLQRNDLHFHSSSHCIRHKFYCLEAQISFSDGFSTTLFSEALGARLRRSASCVSGSATTPPNLCSVVDSGGGDNASSHVVAA